MMCVRIVTTKERENLRRRVSFVTITFMETIASYWTENKDNEYIDFYWTEQVLRTQKIFILLWFLFEQERMRERECSRQPINPTDKYATMRK